MSPYLTFKIISIAVMLVILLVIAITKKTAKEQEQKTADDNNTGEKPIRFPHPICFDGKILRFSAFLPK